MKIKVLSLIAVIFVVVASCTKDTIEPKKVIPVVPNLSSKFSTDVYPVFAANSCTACHGGAGGLSLSGTASVVRTNLLTTGAVVANSSATSKLYTYFKSTSHNGKTFTATEVSNIKGWIDAGALDN
ncbi:MAG: hypothetical protein ACOYO1_11120 [Bacteroidales bacterium]